MLEQPISMHADLTLIIIATTIAALVLLITALLLASIVRRVLNDRMYRKLDAYRQEYGRRLSQVLETEGIAVRAEAFQTKPGSLAWQAVEDVLFAIVSEGKYDKKGRALFQRFGYVAFYEEQLAGRNVLARASAIDKLGRMRCTSSTPKLLPLLEERDPEILAVTVRALSRIGTKEALAAIIGRLPALLGGSLVTRKAMETALLNFGETAIPYLIGHHWERADPWIISCILETLSHLAPDARSVSLAIEHLHSPNSEVRSKALKVLGRAKANVPRHLAELVLPLLEDPVWFVRLQAAISVGTLMLTEAAGPLGKLLFDKNWHVRRQAALALTRFGHAAIDIFHEALLTSDGYAKESVCEEIEKAGFSDWLVANLGGSDGQLRTKSRDILTIMQRLHFSTPLIEYLANGVDERIKQEIRSFLTDGRKP
jgi:HEAT repeat protein